jgi:hypothetical protein
MITAANLNHLVRRCVIDHLISSARSPRKDIIEALPQLFFLLVFFFSSICHPADCHCTVSAKFSEYRHRGGPRLVVAVLSSSDEEKVKGSIPSMP